MIVYFANRKMEILGQASTNLPKGIVIKEDNKVEEIDVGVATFECRITYSDETRATAEQWTEAGNYILRSNDDEKEFYTIINTEIDTKERDIYIYAEDAGMDLLNEILKASDENAAEQTCTEYVETAIYDSGFQIGINESDDSVKKLLKFDEQTASERILDIMKEFELEVSYSFDIERLTVTNKYINIHKKRGKDTGVQLRDGRELDGITIKKTVENLATALLCTGSEDASGVKISLQDYEYDDGDFYVEGHYLKSRNALAKWSRYVNPNEPNKIDNVGHIVQTFTYDTVDQKELCEQAIKELKKKCDIERNYEIEITHLPEGVKIGDMINVVDDAGELYLQSRLLKLETSVVSNTQTATLGDYLIRDSGISEKVEALASQFKNFTESQTYYTWIAYADDSFGNGISLDPDGKTWVGFAENQRSETPDLSKPEVYKWSKVQGDPGVRAVSITNQYYRSTSKTEVKGGSWSDTPLEWQDGKYLWKRNKITWSNDEITYTDPELDAALNQVNKNVSEVTQTVSRVVKFVSDAGGSCRNLYYQKDFADFENLTTANSVYYSKHTAVTAAIDNTVAYHEDKSLKLTYDGTKLGTYNTPLYLGNKNNGYGCVKIEAGKKYILSCYVKADTDVPAFEIDFQGHNEPDESTDGLFLSDIDPRRLPGSSTIITLSKNWQRAVCAFEVSSTAKDLYISPVPLIWGRPIAGIGTFNVWIDCIQLEETDSISNQPTEFTMAKATVIDGAAIKTESVTADKLETNAIRSRNYVPGVSGSFFDLAQGKFDAKNLNWDELGRLYAKDANIEGIINATKGVLKNCSFENGNDELGIKIYAYNDEEYRIRSAATELYAYFAPSGIKITSKGYFVYAGLSEEGLIENGKLIKDIYAAKSHTHWYILSNNNQVGVGDSTNRFCDYSNTDSSGAKVRDNVLALGDSQARWKRVYAANASISTSDQRMKKEISTLSKKYEQLFELLDPVTYRWKGEGHDRIHTGFIAQDVKKAMDEVGLDATEFAAFCYDDFKDDPEWTKENTDGMTDRYSLAYEEFISLNTHMIQKTRQEVKNLQTTLSEAVNTINELKSEIETLKGESK